MTGKDSAAVSASRRLVRGRWSWIVVVAAVTLVVIGARRLSSPSRAEAQGAARGRTAQPAGRTRIANAPARATQSPASLPANPVVAIVNGQQMTRDQLGHEALRRFGEEMLESLVNKHLIAQACHEQNVVITEKDVADEIARMAAKFGLSTDRWLTLLKEERNISAEEYKHEIIWPMLAMRRLAADKIDVTAEELRKAIETEYGPKVKARIIVCSTQQRAEELLAKVKASPEDFGDVAKNSSEDKTSAAARGLVPPIRKHVGDPALEKAAFALKEGEISNVIPVANQFVILKCEKLIPETYVAAQNLTDAEERLREQIRDQKMREAASEMFQRMQEKAQVVNVYNNPELRAKMPGVAATINGKPITLQELADECIQRHGENVLDGEINRIILNQALKAAGKTVTEEDLQEEIRRAADAYGYLKPDGSPDVEGWLQHVTTEGGEGATVDLYVSDAVWPSVALKQLVGDDIEISEEELQQGFEANYGERVEVLAIVLANQRRAQQVWEMARGNPTDQYFGDLASQYSIEPVSRANMGKVPPIRMHGGNDLVEKEAFRLQPGELSGLIAVGDKYIILRCLGRTEPVVDDLAAVRDELIKELREKKLRNKMAAEFDRLKESATVQTYLEGMVTRGILKPEKAPAARTAGAQSAPVVPAPANAARR